MITQMIYINMKTIVSPPPSTDAAIAFHRQFSCTTTFPRLLLPPNYPFQSLQRHKTQKRRITELQSINEENRIGQAISFDNQGPTTHNRDHSVRFPITDVLSHNNFAHEGEQHSIKKFVKEIKSIFDSLDDGLITPSAYDSAFVSLIEEHGGGPMFPSCLQWVANHQLPDGSWGEPLMFSVSDRLINTLACVIALTAWNIHPDKREKGLEFVYKNMKRLEDETEEHTPIGFEITFPSLIDLARKLEIKVPVDSSVFKEIYARRNLKLAKIPKDEFHKNPSSLLYSLEGMKVFIVEWEKLLKLKSKNGSFLCSPAATAFAFMQTKDENCLEYLTNLVAKFNGGVPNVYPVDMFERIWMVDRLRRLGIARYFDSEINDCANYIYRYWDEQGIGWARDLNGPDIDDTVMGFRLLRTNGYQISPDVFRHFKENGQFVCFPKQSTQAVTGMFNLYRISQMLFPGEEILEDAMNFSRKFLSEKRSANKLLDKWLITKDLPGEVGYALDVPWYASLPRLEARYYVEQYGGEDDVWIGKTLYRMGNVSNNKYLEMAKLDYNTCQAIHRLEWSRIQKWYAHLNIEVNKSSRLLWSYYEAAASIFEPERHNERVAWAKTTVMLDIVTSFFAKPEFSNAEMQTFVDGFTNPQRHLDDGKQLWHVVMNALHETLVEISSETLATHGIDIHTHLCRAWTTWLLSWKKGAGIGEAELIVRTINMSSGRHLPKDPLLHPLYRQLSSVTNDLCHQISHKENHTILGSEIDSKMRKLVQLVLSDSPDDLDRDLKQTFLTVARTYYYRAYFDAETINRHIQKVMFENVI